MNNEEKELQEISQAIDELMDKDIELDDNNAEEDVIPSENTPIDTDDDNTSEEENVSNDEADYEKTSLSIDVNEENADTNSYDYETTIENSDIAPYSYEMSETVNDTAYDNNDVVQDEYAEPAKVSSNDFYLGYKARILINVVGIVLFFALSVLLLFASISVRSRSSISYRQASNLDYKVYLKQNDYYSEPYLDKNMRYIASLIDNVNVNFNYNFFANQSIDYKYTYYIKASVAVTDTDDKSKVIYSKAEKLTEPQTVVRDNSTGFTINENIKIDYAKYNDLVKAFKSSYGISAASNLELSLFVGIEDTKGTKIKNLESNEVMKLTIPLTEQMINISMNYNETNNSDSARVYKDFNISNKITLVLSIISVILSLIFIVRLFLFLNKTKARKTIYDVTLSKILREYDRVIVTTRKKVDLNDNIIDVNDFNELLDVRDNLEKPIIFSEIQKGQKSVFVVKTPNETYRYILKLVDLENEKK